MVNVRIISLKCLHFLAKVFRCLLSTLVKKGLMCNYYYKLCIFLIQIVLQVSFMAAGLMVSAKHYSKICPKMSIGKAGYLGFDSM